MRNKSIFYKTLREFFIDGKKDSTFLKNNNLFIATHFRKSSSEKMSPAFISHRCSQWLADLKNQKRMQSLTIEDLEVACEIENEPASVILNDSRYWNDGIQYVTEDFLALVERSQAQPRNSSEMEGVFFPVCLDPGTGTILFAIFSEEQRNLSSKTTNLNEPTKRFKTTYIVYSLHGAAESVYESADENNQGNQPKQYWRKEEALRQYDLVRQSERNDWASLGTGYQVERVIRKLRHHFENKGWDRIAKIVQKQKLFYGFYPILLKKYGAQEVQKKNNLNLKISEEFA